MTELKPCPFCGNNAHITYWGKMLNNLETDEMEDYYTVSCVKCDATISGNDETDVITRWNNRLPIPKKMCANCKHWKLGYDGLGECPQSVLKIISYNHNCDKWETIE